MLGDEQILAEHLRRASGFDYGAAGSRYQSYDIILEHPEVGFQLFEVKRLSKSGRSFDRRFKLGRRSETVYGRRDAVLKRAALEIEEFYGETWPQHIPFDESKRLVDAVLCRRQGKRNVSKFLELARAFIRYSNPGCLSAVTGGVQNQDIVRGFDDLDGIFFVADSATDTYFKLVKKYEIPDLLEFDSVSAEGVKLRFVGPLPVNV